MKYRKMIHQPGKKPLHPEREIRGTRLSGSISRRKTPRKLRTPNTWAPTANYADNW